MASKATDQKIATGPPVGAVEEDDTLLGVRPGYVAVRRGGKDQPDQVVPPRYREGEQFAPGGGSVEEVIRLQKMMISAGLYPKGVKDPSGVWDEATINAYTDVLKLANQQGYDAPQALAALSARPAGAKGGSASGGAGSTLTYTHPDDLRALADRVSRKTLGRKLTGDQLNKFISSYQAMEADAFAGASIPSPEVFATQQGAAANPVAAEAKKQVDVFKTIAGAFGGLGG